MERLAKWVELEDLVKIKMEVSSQGFVSNFLCKICNNFASHSYFKVLCHIGLVHSFDPGFTVTCGVDGCPKTFKKYNSFRKHILRHYKEVLLRSTNHCVDAHDCTMDNLPSNHNDNCTQDTTEHCIADSTVESSLSLEHIKEKVHVNQAALFIL